MPSGMGPTSRGPLLARSGGYQIIARPEAFAATAAAFLARQLAGDTSRTLMLSGGSTPGPVYEILARDPHPDWERIDVYLADERLVPLDDPLSNYRLLRETLLNPAGIPPEHRHPMPVDAATAEEAARRYEAELPDRIDVLVLGVGSDGHTASLFPGSPLLEERERRVAPAVAPVPPRDRLTITPEVIAAAHLVVVLARGPAKRAPVARALSDAVRPAECPARLARSGVWILDTEAAPRAAGAPPDGTAPADG